MKITQLPNTTNTATTMHKLQGSSVDNALVGTRDSKGNWLYVAVSRARTTRCLFFPQGIDSTRNSKTWVVLPESAVLYYNKYVSIPSQKMSTDDYVRVAEFARRKLYSNDSPSLSDSKS